MKKDSLGDFRREVRIKMNDKILDYHTLWNKTAVESKCNMIKLESSWASDQHLSCSMISIISPYTAHTAVYIIRLAMEMYSVTVYSFANW